MADSDNSIINNQIEKDFTRTVEDAAKSIRRKRNDEEVAKGFGTLEGKTLKRTSGLSIFSYDELKELNEKEFEKASKRDSYIEKADFHNVQTGEDFWLNVAKALVLKDRLPTKVSTRRILNLYDNLEFQEYGEELVAEGLAESQDVASFEKQAIYQKTAFYGFCLDKINDVFSSYENYKEKRLKVLAEIVDKYYSPEMSLFQKANETIWENSPNLSSIKSYCVSSLRPGQLSEEENEFVAFAQNNITAFMPLIEREAVRSLKFPRAHQNIFNLLFLEEDLASSLLQEAKNSTAKGFEETNDLFRVLDSAFQNTERLNVFGESRKGLTLLTEITDRMSEIAQEYYPETYKSLKSLSYLDDDTPNAAFVFFAKTKEVDDNKWQGGRLRGNRTPYEWFYYQTNHPNSKNEPLDIFNKEKTSKQYLNDLKSSDSELDNFYKLRLENIIQLSQPFPLLKQHITFAVSGLSEEQKIEKKAAKKAEAKIEKKSQTKKRSNASTQEDDVYKASSNNEEQNLNELIGEKEKLGDVSLKELNKLIQKISSKEMLSMGGLSSYSKKLASISRIGPDWREGKNVEKEELSEKFGIAGWVFGDWVKKAADRQELLNKLYDAFMDISYALEINPKKIGEIFASQYAVGAYGALATNAAGHYMPDLDIINITKHNGVGVLSHEMFHAFTSTMLGKGRVLEVSEGTFLEKQGAPSSKQAEYAARTYVSSIGREGFKKYEKTFVGETKDQKGIPLYLGAFINDLKYKQIENEEAYFEAIKESRESKVSDSLRDLHHQMLPLSLASTTLEAFKQARELIRNELKDEIATDKELHKLELNNRLESLEEGSPSTEATKIVMSSLTIHPSDLRNAIEATSAIKDGKDIAKPAVKKSLTNKYFDVSVGKLREIQGKLTEIYGPLIKENNLSYLSGVQTVDHLAKYLFSQATIEGRLENVKSLDEKYKPNFEARGADFLFETEFYQNAKKFDAGKKYYYANADELGARAWQSFIALRTEQKGVFNPFLEHCSGNIGKTFFVLPEINFNDGSYQLKRAKQYPSKEETLKFESVFESMLENGLERDVKYWREMDVPKTIQSHKYLTFNTLDEEEKVFIQENPELIEKKTGILANLNKKELLNSVKKKIEQNVNENFVGKIISSAIQEEIQNIDKIEKGFKEKQEQGLKEQGINSLEANPSLPKEEKDVSKNIEHAATPEKQKKDELAVVADDNTSLTADSNASLNTAEQSPVKPSDNEVKKATSNSLDLGLENQKTQPNEESKDKNKKEKSNYMQMSFDF